MVWSTFLFLVFQQILTNCQFSESSHSVARRRGAEDDNCLTTFPEFPDEEEDDVKPIVNWKHPWPDGRIFYELSPQFNNVTTKMVHNAMKEISSKTCIEYKERDDEDDYVYIQMNKGEGCFSATGKHGGKQILNLDPSKCLHHGKIVHELMHTTGFHHEHQRPDRDDHIEVIWDNIKEDVKNQFDKLHAPLGYLKGFKYDCGSILHYGTDSDFLAIDNDKPVLRAKNPAEESNMGQRIKMSGLDVRKINLLYNCPKN